MSLLNVTGRFSVSGIRAVGKTAAVFHSVVDPLSQGSMTYNWVDVSTFDNPIILSKLPTYTFKSGDLTKKINIIATYTDLAGGVETITMTSEDFWASLNQIHTGGVKVSGTLSVGSVLTSSSTMSDSDGLGKLHYEFTKVNQKGSLVVLSTQPTYTVKVGDEGSVVTATISYVDKRGYIESAAFTTGVISLSKVTSEFNDNLTFSGDTSTLIGGMGGDYFRLTHPTIRGMSIADFNHSQGDKIDLSAIDAGTDGGAFKPFSLADGKPSIIMENSVNVTPSAAGKLWFDQDMHTLYGSTDFDIDPEIAIQLTGVVVLDAVDIIL